MLQKKSQAPRRPKTKGPVAKSQKANQNRETLFTCLLGHNLKCWRVLVRGGFVSHNEPNIVSAIDNRPVLKLPKKGDGGGLVFCRLFAGDF